jgi:very-short-patch-repair endonuclease
MIISKIDGTVCKNNLGLSIHLKKYGMTLIDYLEKYDGFKKPKCTYCNREVKIRGDRNNINFNKTCGDKECSAKHSKSKIISEETKSKMREKRFNYLSNKENFLKTAWGKVSQNEMTYGEKWLNDILVSEGFYSKYDVVYQYPIFPYVIDFAFVNEKIALEFDGKCHFISGKRIDHDIKRDFELGKKGWRTFRIAYNEMESFKIESFLNFIDNLNIPTNIKNLEERLIKNEEIKKPKENKRELNRIKYDNEQHRIAEIVSTSGIDFSSFGWVNQVSHLTGKKPQKINSWMKRYLPEIYEISYKKIKRK